MAGDAAEVNTKIDTWFNGRCRRAAGNFAECGLSDAAGKKTDVIGVDRGRKRTAVVEGDVKFARQAVEIAMIEDVMVQAFRKRAYVDEFGGIEAAVGRCGDVADVVGAGAT